MLKIAALVIGLLAAATVQPATAEEPSSGPHLVTVVGEVGTPNRGAFKLFPDAFALTQAEIFEAAHGFDYASLAGMKQTTISANAESWSDPITARGPSLADVLAAAGVSAEANVTITALDGYEIMLTPQDRVAHDWVLAIEVNGEPLAIGSLGPAWLVYDTKGGTLGADEQPQWIWAIFLIEAGT